MNRLEQAVAFAAFGKGEPAFAPPQEQQGAALQQRATARDAMPYLVAAGIAAVAGGAGYYLSGKKPVWGVVSAGVAVGGAYYVAASYGKAMSALG